MLINLEMKIISMSQIIEIIEKVLLSCLMLLLNLIDLGL